MDSFPSYLQLQYRTRHLLIQLSSFELKQKLYYHDDVIKWEHFPRYWLLVRGSPRSPVPGDFPAQRPVTPGFDVFFDLRQNKPLSKQIVRLVIWDVNAPIKTSL